MPPGNQTTFPWSIHLSLSLPTMSHLSSYLQHLLPHLQAQQMAQCPISQRKLRTSEENCRLRHHINPYPSLSTGPPPLVCLVSFPFQKFPSTGSLLKMSLLIDTNKLALTPLSPQSMVLPLQSPLQQNALGKSCILETCNSLSPIFS